MRRVLLVDDDPDQLAVRKLVFETAGYSVDTALSAPAAVDAAAAAPPDIVVMDLHLPRAEDGLELIRKLRNEAAPVRIVVLSGFASELAGTPEAAMVDACVSKPATSSKLVRTLARLAVLLIATAVWTRADWRYSFRLASPAEVVADLKMASPGSDWGREGREAVMAGVKLDGRAQQNVMVYTGAAPHTYSIFLGALGAGEHWVEIARHPAYSAPNSPLEVSGAAFREFRPGNPGYDIVAHAPVLYAREDTIGRFTDVPMLVYCERLRNNAEAVLRYTVVYSNEDGGTSTRALMARWGRTTDIDWAYAARFKPDGTFLGGSIQAKDHKEIECCGRNEGSHPVLTVATDNNMVSGEGESPVRYRLAPVLVDLAGHSREQVMDERPWMYRIMAEELDREKKLRPYGVVQGEKVSDPRDYLYIEAQLANEETAVAFLARKKGEPLWRSSSLGRLDFAISRSGWVRTTIEMPPGTRPANIAAVAAECLVVPDEQGNWPQSHPCRVEAVTKMFFLGADYVPGPNIGRAAAARQIPAGEAAVILPRSMKATGTSRKTKAR